MKIFCYLIKLLLRMNFDGSMDIAGNLCCWSPNGRYLAIVVSKARLVIRDAKNLEVLFSEACSSVPAGTAPSSLSYVDDSKLDKVGFSPDSAFVFVCCFKAATTHVFQVFRWYAGSCTDSHFLSTIETQIAAQMASHRASFEQLNLIVNYTYLTF